MAQLLEWPTPTTEIHGSNGKDKNKEKIGQDWHNFLKETMQSNSTKIRYCDLLNNLKHRIKGSFRKVQSAV